MSLRVMCSNIENGCGWMGELQSLDYHLTTCAYALLRCINECMENTKEVHVLRHNLNHHLKSKCPNRQYQCPHCKATGRYCDITTTHLDICPKVVILCPNTGCTVSVPRCDLSKHQSKCQFEKVPCKYAKIGCKKVSLYKDLEQHEKEDAIFHLQLAIETVNKQQKEINELQEEVKVFKEEQETVSDIIIAGQASQTGRCVFKMSDFSRRKSSRHGWRSSPFYTQAGGYKVCVRVNANGFGDAAGTHVSVYACLMKGKNDDTLPWPFTGKVTFTLLNQLADKNHYSNIISFQQDSEASVRVVSGDRGCALGHSKFISHDQLDYDYVKNCQYLKEDCLYFQIKVQTAKPVKPWLTCTV